MAQRRMFNKTIIGSAKFLKMPIDSQNLYFHLGMYADDDGVVEAFPIMRLINSSEDNLKVLSSKGFVTILNEDLVTFVNDWNEHNLIRADRKIDSKYKNLLVEVVKDIKLLEARSRTEETLENRKKEMQSSDLPYSFGYKIKKEFYGKDCPLCNYKMGAYRKPSIQHNIPISKGGKHELENISVICHQCNTSKQDKPTGKLNNSEVTSIWNSMIGLSNDNQLPPKDGIDKVSIDKVSSDKNNTYTDIFLEFYNLYPRKIGKLGAYKKWETIIKKVDPKIIIKSLQDQLNANMFSKEEKFIKHPEVWLNKGCWEDEIKKVEIKNTPKTKSY